MKKIVDQLPTARRVAMATSFHDSAVATTVDVSIAMPIESKLERGRSSNSGFVKRPPKS